MAPSSIRRALDAVKDQTSIGLAKVSNSTTVSDLDVAIVKATRHNEFPAEEKHIREILSLTCYSRAYVNACVSSLSRRLGKTRSWTVALKTLILIHRLLSEGDPAYEQEIYFSTRRGARMLNMSDFRDTSRSDAWDFSAFVRTYSLYLDERLDYRMHGRRKRRSGRSNIREEEAEEEEAAAKPPTPVREMKTERIFVRVQRIQHLLQRFLACRPTGAAKNNRIVAVALYPLVKESFQIYYDLAEIVNIFVDRFMELEVPAGIRVHEIFARLSKQFDELDAFYSWCKSAGVCRSVEFPEIGQITPKKLEIMEEFIREKSALAQAKLLALDQKQPDVHEDTRPPEELDQDYEMNSIKALPAPETRDQADETKEKEEEEKTKSDALATRKDDDEVDLLNLKEDVLTGEEHGNMLALALFDGMAAAPDQSAAPKWEAFADANSSDWELALVQTASSLAGQKASLGGGFDMMLLDGMYAQAHTSAAVAAAQGYAGGGSASSVALRPPPTVQPMLALPAPPSNGSVAASGTSAGADPFAASLMVPAPSYVQMSEMEKKQHLLTQEQLMWKQYARDGMQGQLGLAKLQQQPLYPPSGGSANYHGIGRGYSNYGLF